MIDHKPFNSYVPRLKTFAQTSYVSFCILAHLLNSPTAAIESDVGIKFLRAPESRVVPPGDRVFFNCKTNIGRGENIYWLYNGLTIDPAHRSDVRISNGQLSIKVRTAKRHRERQIGRYQCVGGLNNLYLVSEPATLTVAHIEPFPLEDDDGVENIEANVGNNVLLPCERPESDPPAIIQWFKDHEVVNISDAGILLDHQHVLLTNVSHQSTGNYHCQASNHLTGQTVKSSITHNVTVVSLEILHKPRLLYEPKSSYSPVAGSDLTIPCSATGSPKPTIYWTHHAFNAQPTYMNGSNGLLKLKKVDGNQSGEYTCQIFNGRGRRILRKTVVTVFEKPATSISTFQNSPHKEGDPLELYCNVQGFPVPKVSWMFNGVRKLASHKLVIPGLQVEDAGIYQCFAENEVGVSSSAVLVRVEPKILNSTETTTRKPKSKLKTAKLMPPSSPNVTQLSEDSVMVTWNMPNVSQNIQFFKVQYRDLGTRNDKLKSHWFTADGYIEAGIRSFEVAGLTHDHIYRFRIGVVIDNDHVIGPVSKRFHLQITKESGPTVIPHLQYILATSPTSLSVQWTVPVPSNDQPNVEGYYIYYRDSESAGPYKKITIFGEGTHSHVIAYLKPGHRYDVKVRAFNVHGVGPFSPVQYQRTIKLKKKDKMKVKMQAVLAETRKPEDSYARVYLITGCCLGILVMLSIMVCSVVTVIRRRKLAKEYSDTNAAIHNRYQETSRQISGWMDDQHMVSGYMVSTQPNGNCVYDSTVLGSEESGGPTDQPADQETSFSGASNTEHSGHQDYSVDSQDSTVLAQDSKHTLNGWSGGEVDSVQDEYVDEPSRLSWKRRRKSEEIL